MNQASDKDTPLTMAAWVEDLWNIEQLLGKWADPNKRAPNGCTPLGVATKENYGQIAALLNQAGARE